MRPRELHNTDRLVTRVGRTRRRWGGSFYVGTRQRRCPADDDGDDGLGTLATISFLHCRLFWQQFLHE
jgi:hypothetical protein